MAATTTIKKTEQVKKEKPKKLSKLGQWRRDNPNGIMIVNDPRVLDGTPLFEILRDTNNFNYAIPN
jgi:hypothetical protein